MRQRLSRIYDDLDPLTELQSNPPVIPTRLMPLEETGCEVTNKRHACEVCLARTRYLALKAILNSYLSDEPCGMLLVSENDYSVEEDFEGGLCVEGFHMNLKYESFETDLTDEESFEVDTQQGSFEVEL